MHALLPIALNTFREARRNRVFYAILFFAVGFVLFSVLFTEVTFVAQDRILRDVGFAAISLFALAIAIFLGIGMVNREIEKRTIYTVISKPVPRWSFIGGKFLGLLITLVATVALMGVAFLFTLMMYRSPIDSMIAAPFVALLLELSVITAFAIFCSTWTSSIVSAFLTVSFFFIGHLSRDIERFGSHSESTFVQKGSAVLTAALPDLERFNFKPALAYLQPVPLGELGHAAAIAALWSAFFLAAAAMLFSRRDFR